MLNQGIDRQPVSVLLCARVSMWISVCLATAGEVCERTRAQRGASEQAEQGWQSIEWAANGRQALIPLKGA